MAMEKKVAPIHTIRSGCVKASIWVNKIKDKQSGKEIEVFSVSLIKSYKDGNEWKDTNIYKQNDLPKSILAMQKAFEYLVLRRDVIEGDD